MKKYLLILLTIWVIALLTPNVFASVPPPLAPETLTATLRPCESVSENKTVFLSGIIPKGDVMFAFDLTGSLSDEIAEMKTSAIDIMDDLDLLISDAEYGVMSFMDYPHTYSSYGYSAEYGRATPIYPDRYGDYAYELNLSITSDRTAVSNMINSLVLGWGADEPQDYSRIMYESYADTNVGWRAGAKRILIILGDSLPHDNNLNEGVPGKIGTFSTGGDPGRDEIILNGDDLDLQPVLSEMSANKVTLLFVLGDSPYLDAIDYWDYWTGLTGGDVFELADASEVPEAIETLVAGEAGHVDTLTLIAESGYEAWLTSVVPPEYTNIDIPPEGITKTFDITITVPLDTIPGAYVFHIIADADGASYGEQEVTIIVPFEGVIPEIPFGTIAASCSMIMAFLGYLFIPRFRRMRKPTNL